MHTTILETERLLLRPFRETDLQELFECCQNPNLGNNAGWEPHKSIEDSKEVLHTVFMGNEGVFAIILKEDNSLVGSIGIITDPKRENTRTRMLGYWLDEAHWGKGYMTEAVQAVLNYGFNELQLSLITANCYPHNKRSQQVLERNGFICEGVLHQAELTYNGNTITSVIICLIYADLLRKTTTRFCKYGKIPCAIRITSSRKSISNSTNHWYATTTYRL